MSMYTGVYKAIVARKTTKRPLQGENSPWNSLTRGKPALVSPLNPFRAATMIGGFEKTPSLNMRRPRHPPGTTGYQRSFAPTAGHFANSACSFLHCVQRSQIRQSSVVHSVVSRFSAAASRASKSAIFWFFSPTSSQASSHRTLRAASSSCTSIHWSYTGHNSVHSKYRPSLVGNIHRTMFIHPTHTGSPGPTRRNCRLSTLLREVPGQTGSIGPGPSAPPGSLFYRMDSNVPYFRWS